MNLEWKTLAVFSTVVEIAGLDQSGLFIVRGPLTPPHSCLRRKLVLIVRWVYLCLQDWSAHAHQRSRRRHKHLAQCLGKRPKKNEVIFWSLYQLSLQAHLETCMSAQSAMTTRGDLIAISLRYQLFWFCVWEKKVEAHPREHVVDSRHYRLSACLSVLFGIWGFIVAVFIFYSLHVESLGADSASQLLTIQCCYHLSTLLLHHLNPGLVPLLRSG